MDRVELKQSTHLKNKIPCLICGTHIAPKGNRSIDLVCLICRAAILDRIFRARRRRAGAI
jgi:hypothetical protein